MVARDGHNIEDNIVLMRNLEEIAARELRNAERKRNLAMNNYYAKIIYLFGIFPFPVVNYGLLYRHMTWNNIQMWAGAITERLYKVFVAVFKAFLRMYALMAHLQVLNFGMSAMMNSDNFLKELLTFIFKSSESLKLRRSMILENGESIFYLFNTEAGSALSSLDVISEVFLNFLTMQMSWLVITRVSEDGEQTQQIYGPNVNSLIFRFFEILSANFTSKKPLWYIEVITVAIFVVYGFCLFLLFSMMSQNIVMSVTKKWDISQLRALFTALWPLPGNLF